MRFASVIFALLAGACAAPGPTIEEQARRASDLCRTGWEVDRRARHPRWFSRWVECQREHFMPVEMRAMPRKKDEIREIYAAIGPLSRQVDTREMSLSDFYLAWNRMKAKARLPYCLAQIDDGQGAASCMPYANP